MENHISNLLDKMSEVSQPQRKFMVTLWLTILLLRGKVNFLNLSRYSELNEKTYRRHFQQSFDFTTFNQHLISEAVPSSHEQIGVMDGSYLPKSGKKTYGLDMFYDSSHNHPAKGLELSNLAVVDVTTGSGYTLSCRQTPPQEEIEQLFAQSKAATAQPKKDEKSTRVDFYAAHLIEASAHLPAQVRYIAADGYYAKIKFVQAVRQIERHLISKLRDDANLRYLYTGPQKKCGKRRKFAGKITFENLCRFIYQDEVEPGIHLYTLVVNSVQLKCNIRLVYVLNLRNKQKPGFALLFCTDTDLEAETIYRYYKARFQIEFIFRDAKQFTGLTDCQARGQAPLHFHFNASLTALNLAKVDAPQTFGQQPGQPFSMATQKMVYFNQHLLDRFISNLDLDLTLLKTTPFYRDLVFYGAIAPSYQALSTAYQAIST
jgi:hypothetical protein